MADNGLKAPFVFDIVADSLRLFAAHWRLHVGLSVLLSLPMAALASAGYFAPVLAFVVRAEAGQAVTPDADTMLRAAGILALVLIVTSIYATAWWTRIFTAAGNSASANDPANGPANDNANDNATAGGDASWRRFASVTTKFAALAGLMAGAVVGLSLAAALAALVLGPAFAAIGAPGVVPVLLSAAVQVALLAIGMRLAIAVPPAAWGEDVGFSLAWAASAGRGMGLAAAGLMLTLPALVGSFLVGQAAAVALAGAGAMAGAVAAVVLSPANFLAHGLILTAIGTGFRRLRRDGRI